MKLTTSDNIGQRLRAAISLGKHRQCSDWVLRGNHQHLNTATWIWDGAGFISNRSTYEYDIHVAYCHVCGVGVVAVGMAGNLDTPGLRMRQPCTISPTWFTSQNRYSHQTAHNAQVQFRILKADDTVMTHHKTQVDSSWCKDWSRLMQKASLFPLKPQRPGATCDLSSRPAVKQFMKWT